METNVNKTKLKSSHFMTVCAHIHLDANTLVAKSGQFQLMYVLTRFININTYPKKSGKIKIILYAKSLVFFYCITFDVSLCSPVEWLIRCLSLERNLDGEAVVCARCSSRIRATGLIIEEEKREVSKSRYTQYKVEKDA